MDLAKYLMLLIALFIKDGESGGHGEKHHDHIKLHIPEFIHHDHHTKVITVHHHHQKPKKEQHHHHHHHHKPVNPHGHHYHHQQKKTLTTHTVSKGHEGHGSHSKHHGHSGHNSHHGLHGNHGHYGHGHYNHDKSPSYDSGPASYEHDYGSSFTPSVPTYDGGANAILHTPQVHGISHTVKQVKVYDSLPGYQPTNTGSNGVSHGYEVTEDGEEDDTFTSLNSLQQSYPSTYGYLRGAAAEPASHDPFSTLSQNGIQADARDSFSATHQSFGLGNEGSYDGTAQYDPFVSSDAPQSVGFSDSQPSPEFPVNFNAGDSGFNDPNNSFAAIENGGTSYLSTDDHVSDVPVSFAREAGVQQALKTEALETLVY